ncbi:TraR/DksA C4-type zinc finger protein [Pseudomonas citronellolis]|jgi:phage/conjugal plasmid C-4 type zinc finger TraR family protein|uniref:TraR/DksA C4-type zinc finger protein n=1 Tax=Pseudomonas citronellolis TaxID=53408 RepID=A0AAW6P9L8_9PSED|nr:MULTISPECIES: TraR/DksA C4-type zinc finger protein [Pseudomonas]KWR71270.1 conjugal transfer protein TraR [Pseudomonas sp. PI1]MDF3843380.1 TraR/DksA C4-type zinc finger protein [Pseudomonas citronellolis]WBG64021.1 TraR/DksA family transcriptional regulator [Pseudomonas citronellolis]
MADLADYANDLALERLDALLAARRGSEPEPAAVDCQLCGEPIPEARRLAVPGCNRCLDCQALDELERRR